MKDKVLTENKNKDNSEKENVCLKAWTSAELEYLLFSSKIKVRVNESCNDESHLVQGGEVRGPSSKHN